MHIDSAGNILIGGSFKSKYTDFDPTSGEFGLTSVCNGLGADAFIVKYSPFYITPLRDLKLSGKQQDDKIRLDWQTVAEIATSSFEIEWSDTDTTSFKKIATANAVGAGNNAYQYFHLNLSKGKNF